MFVFVVLFGGGDAVIEEIPINSTIRQENFALKNVLAKDYKFLKTLATWLMHTHAHSVAISISVFVV